MDVDEQGNDELLDFDEEQEFYGGEGAAYGDEQLDYGEEAAYEDAEGTAAQEEYQGGPAQGRDDADAEYLEGLEEADAGEQATGAYQIGSEHIAFDSAEHQQDEHQQSGGGKKIIDLTKTSNRLERLQQRMQPQPQQAPPQQQQQPAPKPQQPAVRPIQQQRAPRSGTGIKRYFMLKSVNAVNWDTARKYSCWATQPQNEQRFDDAFKSGHTVIFFLSINSSGAIQGYGRMMSTTMDGPEHVPWRDIKEQVSNFRVMWDCCAALPFEAVRNLTNPFAGNMPLNRHKDGVEIAPLCGEPLLAAMNRNAAQLGNPAVGPLASWGIQRGVGPAAGGGQPQQQRTGQPGMMGRGGLGGRGMGMQGGMMAGRGVAPGRAMGRGRGGVPQPPPPPRAGAPGFRPGQQQPPAGLARFVGRLEGLTGPGAQQMQQQRHRQPPVLQQQQQHQRGVSPPPRSHHSGSDGYRDGYREPYVRSRSRSRSRSPVSRHAARGDSRSRADVGGRQLDRMAESQSRLESQGSENITYEMYLAAYDKVQQRLKTINKITEKDSRDRQQEQQQQVQQGQVSGRPGVDASGGQLVLYDGGGGSPKGPGTAAAAGGGMMQQRQQMMQQQQRMRPGGAVGVAGVNAGSAMNGGGSVMAGRAVQVPSDIPTLEEYIHRIRASYLQKRGQPCPYTDQQIAAKYQERVAQLKGGGAGAAGPTQAAAGTVAAPAAGSINPRAMGPAAGAAGRQVGAAAPRRQGPPAAGMGAGGMANAQGMPGAPGTSGPMAGNPMNAAAAGGMNPAAAMLNPMMAMNPAMMMGAMNPMANPMAAMAMMGAAAGGLGMGMNPIGMNPGMGGPGAGAAGMGMNSMMMQNMMGQGRMGGRGGGNMGGPRGQQKRGRY